MSTSKTLPPLKLLPVTTHYYHLSSSSSWQLYPCLSLLNICCVSRFLLLLTVVLLSSSSRSFVSDVNLMVLIIVVLVSFFSFLSSLYCFRIVLYRISSLCHYNASSSHCCRFWCHCYCYCCHCYCYCYCYYYVSLFLLLCAVYYAGRTLFFLKRSAGRVRSLFEYKSGRVIGGFQWKWGPPFGPSALQFPRKRSVPLRGTWIFFYSSGYLLASPLKIFSTPRFTEVFGWYFSTTGSSRPVRR